jgi:hypothetical protein
MLVLRLDILNLPAFDLKYDLCGAIWMTASVYPLRAILAGALGEKNRKRNPAICPARRKASPISDGECQTLPWQLPDTCSIQRLKRFLNDPGGDSIGAPDIRIGSGVRLYLNGFVV